jgi:hypothetical protein
MEAVLFRVGRLGLSATLASLQKNAIKMTTFRIVIVGQF